MTELVRHRHEEDGTTTEFTEHVFDGRYPYRAEIKFATIDEKRTFHKQQRLVAIRMSNVPEVGRQPQRNLVGAREIQGL